MLMCQSCECSWIDLNVQTHCQRCTLTDTFYSNLSKSWSWGKLGQPHNCNAMIGPGGTARVCSSFHMHRNPTTSEISGNNLWVLTTVVHDHVSSLINITQLSLSQLHYNTMAELPLENGAQAQIDRLLAAAKTKSGDQIAAAPEYVLQWDWIVYSMWPFRLLIY